MDVSRAEKIIKDKLSPSRYQHSMQVAMMARDMARKYRLNEDKAYLAGVVHDYAKDIAGLELLSLAQKYDLLEHEGRKVMCLIYYTLR